MEITRVNIESPETPAPLPTEPFACPECGQMLAATCRICVACQKPVDLAKIETPTLVWTETQQRTSSLEPARFSWKIFFVVLLGYIFLVLLSQALLGFKGSTYAMGGFVAATSLWVFFDSSGRNIRRPAGWAIACLLLWLVFFPWYVSRRRTPDAPCPIIEAESGPVARAIILFLIVMTVAGAVMMVLSGDFSLR